MAQPLLPSAESLWLPSAHKAWKGEGGSRGQGPSGLLSHVVNKYLLNTHSKDVIEVRRRHFSKVVQRVHPGASMLGSSQLHHLPGVDSGKVCNFTGVSFPHL